MVRRQIAQAAGWRQRTRATPTRSAKTTRMFKSPGLYPNALAVMTDGPGGLWIGQQKVTPQNAVTYNLPLDPDRDEEAWLVDWNGKLLKTVNTHSRNTSGMAYGNGCVWMGANADPYGIFQVDMNSKANQPPPDSAQHRRQRWWVPWREVAQRQALDCRPAPGRHPACRSDDVGSRSPDPGELGGEAPPPRRGVRQRGSVSGS